MFFRKKKPYLFNGFMHGQEKQNAKQEFKCQVQVILCGTLARDIISATKKPELIITEEKSMYAFLYDQHGKINFDITMDLDAEIKYQETRQKKHKQVTKEIDFTHHDKSSSQASTSHTSTTNFKLCEPDFNSPLAKVIVIAGKDNQENDEIENILEKNIKNNSVLKYHILAHPTTKDDRTIFTWRNNIETNNRVIHCIPKDVEPKSIARSIVDDLDKHANQHIKTIQENIEKEMQAKILKEIENKLHQQADNHFDKPRRIFR